MTVQFVSDLNNLYGHLLMTAIVNNSPKEVFKLYHNHTRCDGLYAPEPEVQRRVALFLYKATSCDSMWLEKAAKVVLHATNCGLYPQQPRHEGGKGVTIIITTSMERWEIHLMIVACLNSMHHKFVQMMQEGMYLTITDFNVEIIIQENSSGYDSCDTRNRLIAVVQEDFNPPIQVIPHVSTDGCVWLSSYDVKQYMTQKKSKGGPQVRVLDEGRRHTERRRNVFKQSSQCSERPGDNVWSVSKTKKAHRRNKLAHTKSTYWNRIYTGRKSRFDHTGDLQQRKRSQDMDIDGGKRPKLQHQQGKQLSGLTDEEIHMVGGEVIGPNTFHEQVRDRGFPPHEIHSSPSPARASMPYSSPRTLCRDAPWKRKHSEMEDGIMPHKMPGANHKHEIGLPQHRVAPMRHQGRPRFFPPNNTQGKPRFPSQNSQQREPRFHTNRHQGEPSFHQNRHEGSPMHHPSITQQGEPRFHPPNSQQGEPKFLTPNSQQEEPRYLTPNSQQGEPRFLTPNSQQGETRFHPNNHQGEPRFPPPNQHEGTQVRPHHSSSHQGDTRFRRRHQGTHMHPYERHHGGAIGRRAPNQPQGPRMTPSHRQW